MCTTFRLLDWISQLLLNLERKRELCVDVVIYIVFTLNWLWFSLRLYGKCHILIVIVWLSLGLSSFVWTRQSLIIGSSADLAGKFSSSELETNTRTGKIIKWCLSLRIRDTMRLNYWKYQVLNQLAVPQQQRLKPYSEWRGVSVCEANISTLLLQSSVKQKHK